MSVKYCSQIVAQVHTLHSIIHSIMFLILIHSIGAHRIQGDGVVYRVNKIIMHAGFSRWLTLTMLRETGPRASGARHPVEISTKGAE